MNSSHKAFTLIEMIIVMAVIGIIAGIGIVALSNLRSNATTNTLESRLHQLNIAKEQFISEYGRLEAEQIWANPLSYGTAPAWYPGQSQTADEARYNYLKRYIERPQSYFADVPPQGCTITAPTNVHGFYTGAHTLDNGNVVAITQGTRGNF